MFRRRAPRHGFTATVPAAPAHSVPAPAPAAPVAGSVAASVAGRDPGGPPPAGLDVSAAHPARVWNYWLGGRDYFAADRAAGEQIGRGVPRLAPPPRAQ